MMKFSFWGRVIPRGGGYIPEGFAQTDVKILRVLSYGAEWGRREPRLLLVVLGTARVIWFQGLTSGVYKVMYLL